MKYYKIISDSKFIGVGTDSDMRKYQLKHRILLICTPEQAQYIQNKEILYRAQWMLPEGINDLQPISATVIEITESEYDALKSAVDSGADIPIDNNTDNGSQDNTDNPTIDKDTEITIDFVKKQKINEMSVACSNVITHGFDVVLSDNESHHFSLTTQDQLNLITVTTLMTAGETSIPYHADGELCKFYSPDDMTIISTGATNFKTYHVSYFNSLKSYIESLNDIETISAITYGFEIPSEYMSDVLKVLVNQTGSE